MAHLSDEAEAALRGAVRGAGIERPPHVPMAAELLAQLFADLLVGEDVFSESECVLVGLTLAELVMADSQLAVAVAHWAGLEG
jgi:hypothetical protein